MKPVIFTKEEADSLLIQLGARLDALKVLQEDAGLEKNIERVLELERAMQPIISGRNKIMDSVYK